MEENTPTTCVYLKIDKNMRLILMCLVFGASITQYLRVNTPDALPSHGVKPT